MSSPKSDIGMTGSAKLMRSPREVIDAAIAENKKWEYTYYVMIVAFCSVALLSLTLGAVYNSAWAFGCGSSAVLGFWMVLSKAHSCWRENQYFRMLELGLNDPQEAKATHAALRKVILSHVSKEEA